MNDLAIIQNDDGWGDAAAESGEYIIKGSLLKFADWKWTKGKESIEVKHGTAFVALGTTAAWVKWSGGKPIEYKVRQAGHRLPDRDELGDLEEGDWEIGPGQQAQGSVGEYALHLLRRPDQCPGVHVLHLKLGWSSSRQ